uniref:Uncharacterized protein n=1 Tax=Meloidogyne hapla TaxID=6305 RepID=A0A1I8BDC8_MELHA
MSEIIDFEEKNCCRKTERDIYEDVQGTTQIIRRGEDPPSGQVRSSSADTEEKEAANREAFEKNEAANREIARNAFIASRGGVEKFPGEFAWLDEVSSDEAGPSLLLPDRGVFKQLFI